jgi:hypothetical protein
VKKIPLTELEYVVAHAYWSLNRAKRVKRAAQTMKHILGVDLGEEVGKFVQNAADDAARSLRHMPYTEGVDVTQ